MARCNPELRGLLDRMHAVAAAQGRAGSIIEIQPLQALALAAAGDENAAVGTLAGGADPRLPARLCPVFADEAAPMNACSPGWSLPRGQSRPPPAMSCSAASPAYCARLAARTPGGAPPRRCRAWSTSSPPVNWRSWRCSSRAPQPGHRRAAGGHPRHGQEAGEPHSRQARRGQPHQSRHPGTPARPYPLAAFATIRCGATVPAAGPGTTVPARQPRKIPPSGAPSGDDQARKAFVACRSEPHPP